MFDVEIVTAKEPGLFSNTYLLESKAQVVIIDPPMLVDDAVVVKERLVRRGRPLAGIVYTHPHPDHVNGGTIVRGDTGAPIFATARTAAVMREIDGPKRVFWLEIHGDNYPRRTTFPTVLVEEGTVEVGPFTFKLHDIGAGECVTAALWIVDRPDHRVAFIGDLAYNDVHPWLFEGRTRSWLAQLASAETLLGGHSTLYPGHGASGGLDMLARQSRYIAAYRSAVSELARGRTALTDDEKSILEATMIDHWPAASLTSLIALSADSVARELAEADTLPI